MYHDFRVGLVAGIALTVLVIAALFVVGVCELVRDDPQPKTVFVPGPTPTATAIPVTPIPVIFVTPVPTATPSMGPGRFGSGGLLPHG